MSGCFSSRWRICDCVIRGRPHEPSLEFKMSRILGYITPVRAFSSAGEISMQAASGRVAEALAKHFEKVCVCARVVQGPPPAPFDVPLNATNLELIAQPFWGTSAGSLIHLFGIARAYMRTCQEADVLFIRGSALTRRCCIFAPRYFANRFVIGSSVIPSRCCERTKGRGAWWIRLPCSTRYRTGSSRGWGVGHQRRIDLQRPRVPAPTHLHEQSKSFRARFGTVSFFLAPIPARAQSCESFLLVSFVRRRESSTCWTLSRSSRRMCRGSWRLSGRANSPTTARNWMR